VVIGKQVGVTANCDGSKELSSVQSFSSDYSWSALNKVDLHLQMLLLFIDPAGARLKDFELYKSFISIALPLSRYLTSHIEIYDPPFESLIGGGWMDSHVGGNGHGRVFMKARVNRCIPTVWISMLLLVRLMQRTRTVAAQL
jgi:hypothetical protein